MRTKPLALVVFCFVLGAAAAAAQPSPPSFEFDPAEPRSLHPVRIKAAFHSPCSAHLGRAEVLGGVIRLTVFEGCDCPALPPDQPPTELATTVEPLAAGTYTVELVAAPSPFQPGCTFRPQLLGSTELVVAPWPTLFQVEPPEPTALDEVTVTLLNNCPVAFDLPSRQGSVIRVTQVPSLSLAPCVFPDPPYGASFPLGRLPAGDYAVTEVFLDIDQDAPPVMISTHSFRVHGEPKQALLLQDGRFRVTAEWALAQGPQGAATAMELTADTGFFWFRRPGNLELTVKLLRACDVDGHYWFFASGMTNVAVTLRVEDLLTGRVRSYSSPQGTAFAPIQDTAAFACP